MTKHAARAAQSVRIASRPVRPRTRRVTQPSSLKKRLKTFLAVSFLAVETGVAITLVCLLFVFWKFSSDLPSVESIAADAKGPVATTIWSEDGVLLGKLDTQNRQPIALDELGKSSRVIDATIAIEDHRFYEHPGIDVIGIMRSAVANVRGSTVKQGASTLTQQLVRQPGIGTQLGLSAEKRFSRKVREALVALRVEQFYSKKEILQLYLNNVYYGGGAYGIQAASLTYFGKSAYKLNLAESALLAGLPQSPSQLSPFGHRKAALKRRDEVLTAMKDYGYITQAQLEQAKAEKPKLMPPPRHDNFDFKAPYFTTYVLKELTKRYGWDMVYSGLTIRTTLNYKMQQNGENALLNGLQNAAGYGANQGALVSLDPQTGYIRTMVGGRNFHASQYNAVTQGKRQPGSIFKVFDYTTAFETGRYDLDSSFIDKPIPYPNDPSHKVTNYGGSTSGGPITFRTAIMFSKNTIAIQVAQAVGIESVIATAHKMGITSHLEPVLPTSLGASAVHPLDLCSAYSIFPANGNRYHPMAILKVTDADGNIIESGNPQVERDVLRQESVRLMDEALEGVVTKGTGTLARGSEGNGLVEGARGKTGTTSDNRDAWFAGYTPELATVIWVASVHKTNGRLVYREMNGATGGHQCAPIWHEFMVKAVPEQRKFNQATGGIVPTIVKPSLDEPEPRRRRPRTVENKQEKPLTDTSQPATNTGQDSTGDTPPGNDSTDKNKGDAPPAGQSEPDTVAPTENALHHTSGSAPAAVNPGGIARIRTNAPPVAPLVRSAPPPAPPEMVNVKICSDSGDLANSYCDAFKTVRMTATQAARMRRCRVHRPPPGERGDG